MTSFSRHGMLSTYLAPSLIQNSSSIVHISSLSIHETMLWLTTSPLVPWPVSPEYKLSSWDERDAPHAPGQRTGNISWSSPILTLAQKRQWLAKYALFWRLLCQTVFVNMLISIVVGFYYGFVSFVQIHSRNYESSWIILRANMSKNILTWQRWH